MPENSLINCINRVNMSYERSDTMASKMTVIQPKKIREIKELRVCAYARVSAKNDDMLHSLGSQVAYYIDYISSHPGWKFVEVFHDKPITGTKEQRPEFLRMIEMCRRGEIDMIITKSISRFARNTVTALTYTRELKNLGVDVFFEMQNIHTMSSDGEIFLTCYASFAQDESLSVSQNCKWRIKKGFENGKMTDFRILGYDWVDHQLYINPKEAEIIKRIYSEYLEGKGLQGIANGLNKDGIKTKDGNSFGATSIRCILSNEKYIGDLILQKSYYDNYLTKKKMKNNGELDRFFVQDNHDPIIDRGTFERVQLEMQERSKNTVKTQSAPTVFTSLLTCGNCAKHYRKKKNSKKVVWMCPTYNLIGKSACDSQMIREDILKETSAKALDMPYFDEEVFKRKVKGITVLREHRLIYFFTDGTSKEMVWKPKSRAEAWTPEMKEKQSKLILERNS